MVLLLILLMWATPSLTCKDLGKRRERGGGAIFTQLNDRGCGGVADVGEFLPHLQGQGEVWGAVSSQLNSRGCGVVVDMGDFSLTCNDWMGGGGRESVCGGGGGLSLLI